MGYSTKTGGRSATSGVIPGQYALSVGNPETELPVGWKWTRLTDVARLETGHTPSRKHPEYWDGDVPWLGIKDAGAHHGRVIEDTIQHTNQLGLANSSARLLPTGTVCLSRTASVGYVTVMGRPMCTSQDFVNWVCGPELHRDWLKYILLLEQKALLIFAHGSTHQTIYFPEVKAFHVALPPIEEQVQRLRILQALDAKIELNRRQNETLEAMAQALFKSWFVDFDPVLDNALETGLDIPEPLRARAERRRTVLASGQYPRLAADVRGLFPDRFVWQEALGKWCPAGWEVREMKSDFIITMGQSPPGSTYNEDNVGLPFFQGRRDFGNRFPSNRVYCTEPKRLAERGDVIMSVRAPVGDTNVAVVQSCIGRGVASIRHKRSLTSYTLYVIQNFADIFERYNGEGTVFGSINGKRLSSLQIVTPPMELISKFETTAKPLDDQVECNHLEATTLSSLRDLLLGELIG